MLCVCVRVRACVCVCVYVCVFVVSKRKYAEIDQSRHEQWRNDPVPTRPLEPGPIPTVPCAHLRADDRAPDLVDHRDEADAGGSRAESGDGRARTERRPALESSSTCRGGGAVRLRPRPSPASAASAACIGASSTRRSKPPVTKSTKNLLNSQHARKTRSLLSTCIYGIASDNTTQLTLAATERGDLPGPSTLPPLPPAPPRVERGVGAPLAAPVRVERGVADVSAGLCKNFEGLMPGTERVERGLDGAKRR